MEETKLSKSTIQKIKENLVNRKDQLIKDLQGVAKKECDTGTDQYKAAFPEYGNKPDENAQEISDYSSNLAKEEVLEKTLRDIESAIKRIDDGTYGICKYCSESINPKRLEARPTASSCMHCKTELQNS